jgi:hypothetical protein
MQKTLQAALALSPSNKAVTAIDDSQWLIIERHLAQMQYLYSATIVDLKRGDTTHATGMRTGPADLQDWLDAVAWYTKTSLDIMEKRWICLEEARVTSQGTAN